VNALEEKARLLEHALLHEARGISYEVWEGVVTGDEWVQHVRRQVADRNWPAGDKSLTDLQLVSENTSIGKAEIKQVSAIYRTKSDKLAVGKSAIVAGKSFQKTPLYGLFASRHGLKVIIFSDIGTACKWLGIDPKEAEQMVKLLRARMRGETSGRG
jgi:hypothetical protein